MSAAFPNSSRTGLVLTGGGARAAYQVGVLKAIAELLPRGAPSPFPVIAGTSAGAVSAVVLAADAAHFRRAVYSIERVWRDFRINQVFKADSVSMLRSGLHWLLALTTGGWIVPSPHAIFDNAPLWSLLREHLDFTGISRSLYREHLHAVAVSATSYADSESVAFFSAAAQVEPWQRAFRKGARVQLTLEHVMASLAIPFLFRPVAIAGQFFGDGAMRQTAPLSAALHLGADKLLIIGVREPDGSSAAQSTVAIEPRFGQMFGFMLDTLFMDQIVADIERMNNINDYVHQPSGGERRARKIDSLVITPSKEVGMLARKHRRALPMTLRVLLRTLGADDSSGHQLISYLLFERVFTRDLIALGYEDGMRRCAELREFLQIDSAANYRMRAK